MLIVVEDQVSAIKVAPHFDALALLGTGISEAKAQEIEDGKYKYIYLCLDNDATYQAIKLQLEWRHKLPNMRVLSLEKDIKDMNEQEFKDFLRRVE